MHSEMWFEMAGRAQGPRTDAIKHAIIQHNLTVHNKGTEPTFSSHLGQTIIDVALSSDPNCVTSWQVIEEVSHSDHRVIRFNAMEVNTTPAVMKRNLKKVNWASVAHDLRRSTYTFTHTHTEREEIHMDKGNPGRGM
jgi:hypothetical protein